jgi:hypothetical protein
MSFRLTFEATAPGSHFYGSDQFATAEWHHCIRFPARCIEDFETDLTKGAQEWGSMDNVIAGATLVVEPLRTERVLPSVFLYPDDDGKVTRIEAFTHVPTSFVENLKLDAKIRMKIAFRQDWRALFEMDGGDRLGRRCSIKEGNNVVVEMIGGA